jgi:hypothetical protein
MKVIAAIVAGVVTLVAGAEAAAAADSWNFRVLLNGDPIGVHRFTLQDDGPRRALRSEAQFDVRLLFFNAYRYRHEALEQWDGDCLAQLTTQTDTNSEQQSVRAALNGGRFVVESGGRRDVHEGADRCVMSFAYWNPRILDARRLLNSQTGELTPVTVATLGEESIAVRGRMVSATRYRITATGLSIDLWYADRRWVGLESLLQNGRRLRYELM